MLVNLKQLPNAEIEISGELSGEQFAAYRAPALKQLHQTVTIDGFRPGHIPENVLVAKLGKEKILLEMAELALREHYPKIITENKIAAIGRPEITITKIATDNPLGFKIKTAVEPTVKLPDYKKIAREINATPVEAVMAEGQEDKLQTSDKRRLQIMAEIIKASEFAIPPLLRENEARVKVSLVLNHIAETEKISAPEEEMEKEVKHFKEHYPKAEPERLRAYVVNMLINEHVWRWLESQK